MVEDVSRADLERLDCDALIGLVLELVAEHRTLRTEVADLRAANEKLAGEAARLRVEAAKNSGNELLPVGRTPDPAAGWGRMERWAGFWERAVAAVLG